MRPSENAWQVPREWDGEACFIIGGGASVLTQDLSLLGGRRVIAINSSCWTYPAADYVFFADQRWWRWNWQRLAPFAGRLVTCADNDRPEVKRLKRNYPPGLSTDPKAVTTKWTSMQGAINLAVLLGAHPLVTLGLDGKGGSHHAPHPVAPKAGAFNLQKADLVTVVGPLKEMDIPLYNASPGSAVSLWPTMTLVDAITLVDGRQRQAA